jgi:sulfatase modifying factor 1
MKYLLALPLILSGLGCSAIFGVESGTLDANEVHIQGAPFSFSIEVDQLATSEEVPAKVHSSLSHAFALDEDEVTVGRFKAWIDAGQPVPKDGASLDEGGPYERNMVWSSDFAKAAGMQTFKTPACQLPPNGHYEHDSSTTTFELGSDDYPMTCVTWAQAAAFCAFEKKRLPSNAEWQFAAQGGDDQAEVPFSGPIDCAHATVDVGGTECKFPVPVGTAKGTSKDGVLDMGGSVVEWTWDANDYTNKTPLPSEEADDYAGTGNNKIDQHLLRGAEYYTPVNKVKSQNGHAFAGDSSAVSDVGVRCARTILPPD